jgi:hypothetical protein
MIEKITVDRASFAMRISTAFLSGYYHQVSVNRIMQIWIILAQFHLVILIVDKRIL